LLALKQAQVVSQNAKVVKVISTGKIERAVQLGAGIKATASAKAAIEAAGGKLSD
jgi:large subunit ribosomal protein L15